MTAAAAAAAAAVSSTEAAAQHAKITARPARPHEAMNGQEVIDVDNVDAGTLTKKTRTSARLTYIGVASTVNIKQENLMAGDALCPKCSNGIPVSEKCCPVITCPKCKFHFCYHCKKYCRDSGDLYSSPDHNDCPKDNTKEARETAQKMRNNLRQSSTASDC